METENITSVNPEKLKESSENNKEGAKQPSADGERMETEAKMDVDGDVVETMTVERGSESWFHTRLDNLSGEFSAQADVESVRKELEEQLATWSQVIIKNQAIRLFGRYKRGQKCLLYSVCPHRLLTYRIVFAIIRQKLAGSPELGRPFRIICCHNILFVRPLLLNGRATLAW